ncbi:unnamed protein product [Lactuca virosa]|uniref:Ribosome biogenesis protein NOP53 n=1 Tax=Lactuca virosa TaxID=75947 RepID=A0AAU9M3F8_9ASTR|nr:unnamed protein product [Lactuca virosa]
MLVDSPALKRRRFADQLAMEKRVAAKKTYGREIRVFETTTATISQTSNDVSGSEEPDDLEFTTADYYRILATKKEDTIPPKKQIKNMSQDFYSAGFAPGDDNTVAQSPFLKEDVMALKDLDGLIPEPVVMAAAPVQKPAGEKKMVKPKWLKM